MKTIDYVVRIMATFLCLFLGGVFIRLIMTGEHLTHDQLQIVAGILFGMLAIISYYIKRSNDE